MEAQVEGFDYVPRACEDEKDAKGEVVAAAKFHGKVVLKRVSMLERYEKLPELERLLGEKQNVRAAIHAVKSTEDLWLGVDLTHVKSGKRLTSLRDLLYFNPAEQIVQEVAFGILQGGLEERDRGN